jgi:hypothetical protein
MNAQHQQPQSLQAQVAALDDEDVWIQPAPLSASIPLHAGLRELELSCRCTLGLHFLRAPVAVQPCQHVFCSECIRQHLSRCLGTPKRETFCPSCHQAIDVSGVNFNKCLVPNRSMEIQVGIFQKIRTDLRVALVDSVSNSSTEGAATDFSSSSLRQSSRQNPMVSLLTSSSSTAVCSEVPPPDPVLPGPSAHMPIRKSKPHYSSLKKKGLQDLCRKEGLSETGSEKDLITRHQNWIIRYNANCDSYAQRSTADLLAEFNQNERDIAAQAKKDQLLGHGAHATHRVQAIFEKRNKVVIMEPGAQQLSGAFDAVHISSGDAAFDEKFSSTFQKLKKELMERKASAKRQKLNQRAASDAEDASCSNSTSGATMTSTSSNNARGTKTDTMASSVGRKRRPAESAELSAARTGSNGSSPDDKPLVQTQQASVCKNPYLRSSPMLKGNNTTTATIESSSQEIVRPARAVVAHQAPGTLHQLHAASTACLDCMESASTLLSVGKVQLVAQADTSSTKTSANDVTSSKTPPWTPHKTTFPASSSSGIIGLWACPRCTFDNLVDMTSAQCEMCKFPRPAPAARTLRGQHCSTTAMRY